MFGANARFPGDPLMGGAMTTDGEGSAQERAYRHLLDGIRSGALASGARVVAEAVAQELGTSRMPVRDAIRQLASEGFMTIRSNRGAVVTPLSPEAVGELYEMRAVLEGFAMRLTAERIDAKGLEEADLALTRLDRARGDVDWFVEAHDTFHDVLLGYCPRPRLVGEIRRIRSAAEPYLRITLGHSATATANTTDEHRRVLAAVRTGNPDVAEAEMRAHVLATDVTTLLPGLVRA